MRLIGLVMFLTLSRCLTVFDWFGQVFIVFDKFVEVLIVLVHAVQTFPEKGATTYSLNCLLSGKSASKGTYVWGAIPGNSLITVHWGREQLF